LTTYYLSGPAGRCRGQVIRAALDITTDFQRALQKAAAAPRGRIYLVEPIGKVSKPDGGKPDTAFRCAKALVLRVIQPPPFSVIAAKTGGGSQ
jgi:hypothetical protein